MINIERTTRFGGFPALKIGRFCAVYFEKSRLKCGMCFPRNVQMKHGIFNLIVLNIGQFVLMLESPSAFDGSKVS